MKYILTFICCILFAACGSKHNTEHPMEKAVESEMQEAKIDMKLTPVNKAKKNKVEMEILTDSCTRPFSKFYVRVTNNSNIDLTTGEDYRIEMLEFNRWSEVPINFAFTDIGYGLAAKGGSHVFTIGLSPEEYEYMARRYRVVKKVSEHGTSFPFAVLEVEFDLSR